MSEEANRMYLGDSVYAELVHGQIELSTDNGFEDDPRNVIYLNDQVFNALLIWAKHVGLMKE